MDIFEAPDLTQETFAEGYHPLELFLKGDTQERSEILLNHPEVIGFMYRQSNDLMKGFFCTKVIDWHESGNDEFKVIAAINGTTDDFVPFSVPENLLFSDQLHLVNADEIKTNDIKSCAISKYIRDNKKTLNICDEYTKDPNLKHLRIAAFPTILPLIRGLPVPEGNIFEEAFKEKVSSIHPIYGYWIRMKTGFWCNDEFVDDSCPLPKSTGNEFMLDGMLKPAILYKSPNVQGYRMLKELIERHSKAKKFQDGSIRNSRTDTIPREVALTEEKTVVTAVSSESKVSNKNERLVAFMSILLSTPNYDRAGKLISMTPAHISDEAMEILTANASLSEQARSLSDSLTSLARDTAEEMQYLSRFTNLPYLSQTVLSYILQANYHSGPIDHSLESIKKSFSILCLLRPPEDNEEYKKYINSSRNTEVECMLDTPAEKKGLQRKEVFMKGRQESLDDVITLAANIKVFGKFWFKVTEEVYHQQPLVITLMEEIANYISTQDFKHFYEKHHSSTQYIPHTIIVYMFNVFSMFVSTAKNREYTQFIVFNKGLLTTNLQKSFFASFRNSKI